MSLKKSQPHCPPGRLISTLSNGFKSVGSNFGPLNLLQSRWSLDGKITHSASSVSASLPFEERNILSHKNALMTIGIIGFPGFISFISTRNTSPHTGDHNLVPSGQCFKISQRFKFPFITIPPILFGSWQEALRRCNPQALLPLSDRPRPCR